MQAYQTSTVDTLFEDIKAHGFNDIVSLHDPARLDKRHRSLIPVILSYLNQVDDIAHRDVLVRSLGVKGFNEAVAPLIEEFRSSADISYKWRIGDTIWALSYFKRPELISHINPFTQHEKGWVRREANKAIKKLQKLQ